MHINIRDNVACLRFRVVSFINNHIDLDKLSGGSNKFQIFEFLWWNYGIMCIDTDRVENQYAKQVPSKA